jgi:hypothetical protein
MSLANPKIAIDQKRNVKYGFALPTRFGNRYVNVPEFVNINTRIPFETSHDRITDVRNSLQLSSFLVERLGPESGGGAAFLFNINFFMKLRYNWLHSSSSSGISTTKIVSPFSVFDFIGAESVAVLSPLVPQETSLN